MKLSKDKKRVMIETTNRAGNCLEVNGICGRIDTYDAKEVMDLLNVTLDELIELDECDYITAYPMTNVQDLIEHDLKGKCYRKGVEIQ